MMRIDWSWSGSPQAPNIIAPRHSLLTETPVRPSGRRRGVLLVADVLAPRDRAAGPRRRLPAGTRQRPARRRRLLGDCLRRYARPSAPLRSGLTARQSGELDRIAAQYGAAAARPS